jgi:hypothetical protein
MILYFLFLYHSPCYGYTVLNTIRVQLCLGLFVYNIDAAA